MWILAFLTVSKAQCTCDDIPTDNVACVVTALLYLTFLTCRGMAERSLVENHEQINPTVRGC